MMYPCALTHLLLPALCLLNGTAAAQATYPNKPIRILTAGVGSGADFAARLIAQGAGESLRQPMIVENRGSGVVPGEMVAKAPADGYTLLLMGTTFWLAPFLRDSTPYDPLGDFAPITMAAQSPNIMVVHSALPVRSVKDLIELAKARPGELNYYSGGSGATNHLAAELFKSMAGIDIVRVPYKNSAQGLTDLMTGAVQLTITTPAAALPYVKSGRLRALGVASPTRSPLVPGLPAIAETLPGYQAVTFNALFAPVKTPESIIQRLNQEIVRALNRPDIKGKFFSAGVEIRGSSPGSSLRRAAQLLRYLRVVRALWLP